MRYHEIIKENRFEEFAGANHFNNWSDFGNKLKNALKTGFSSEKELCSLVGIDYELYNNVINGSIENWRDSTSKSLLHGIGHIDTNIPQPGQQIFPNLLWQTRFLTTLLPFGLT